jgi:hypothetical protein
VTMLASATYMRWLAASFLYHSCDLFLFLFSLSCEG